MPHDTSGSPVPPRAPDGTILPGATAGPAAGAPPHAQLGYLPAMVPHGQPGMGFAPAASSQGAALNSAGMLKALRKRWVVAIVVGLLLGGLAAAGTWMVLPPARFSGEVIFDIDHNPPLLPTRENRNDWVNYQRYQQVLITSQKVLTPAVNDLGDGSPIFRRHGPTTEDVVGWLQKELKPDYQLGPSMLHIAIKEDDRADLLKLLNAIGTHYLEVAATEQKNSNESSRKALEKAVGQYNREITKKRGEYDNKVSANRLLSRKGKGKGKTNPDPSAANQENKTANDFARTDAREAHLRLTRLEDEIGKALGQVEILQQKVQHPPQISIPESTMEKVRDAEIEGYQREIAQITPVLQELMKLRNYPWNPTYQDNRRRLVAAQQGIAARRTKLRQDAEKQAQALALNQAKENLATAEQKLALLKGQLPKLEQAATTLRNKAVSTASGAGVASPASAETEKLEGIKREIDELESYRNQLNKRLARLQVDSQNPLRVEQFTPVMLPSSDIKIFVAATAGVGLLVFGLFAFGVSWMEFRQRRIDTADEVLYEVGLPLVGTIPEFSARRRALTYGGRTGVSEQAQQSILAESIDTTRTMLLHAARAESLRAVMIASAAPREGKTTLACQLATSLARAGRKTLLIDADLRKPMLHDLYSLPNAPGLGGVLRGEVSALDAVCETFTPGLWLLAAGQTDTRALQAISHEQFHRHLHHLKSDFDFIIIDSSPILSAVESLLVAQQADAVVFSVLVEVSQVPAVQAAYRRLQTLGIRILGAVANGTATEQSTYGMTAYAYAGGAGMMNQANEAVVSSTRS